MKQIEALHTEERTPFALSFFKKLSKETYENATIAANLLKVNYDPKTQTSNAVIYAGTSLTYSDTYSDLLQWKDDTRQSDT